MKISALLVSLLLAVSLTACGNKNVSFDTLEEAKGTARDNALFNAQRYRAEQPEFQSWKAVSNGDSSQTNQCPQGDGWATLKLYNPEATRAVAIKCSTVSGNTQCMTDAEFKSKPFASEDGHCNDNVPFPLPKISK